MPLPDPCSMVSWVLVRPQIRNLTTPWPDHRPDHGSPRWQLKELDQVGTVEGLPGHCLPLWCKADCQNKKPI